MRVLIVNAHPILPLTHGGRVRTMGLASGLIRTGASVDLLCPWAPGEPWRPWTQAGVRCIPHRFVTNALRLLPGGVVPPLVALSYQPYAVGPRRRLARASSYDIVQFEFCAYASWMQRLRHETRIVYSAHNVEHDQHAGEARDSPLLRAWMGRVRALERRAVHAGHLVVTCTERDVARLGALYRRDSGFAVIPNGFDDALLHAGRDDLRARTRASLGIADDAPALLFVGGRALHNRRAVEFLEASVLPRLPRGGRLLVAGACGDDLPRPPSDAALRLGYIEDLRPIIAAADVAVNPVAHGSGSNLKMAEYLAAGLPVVTTPIGARGFEERGGAIRLAELDRFADAVIDVVEQRPAGRPAADVADLSWTVLARRLRAAYERALAEP